MTLPVELDLSPIIRDLSSEVSLVEVYDLLFSMNRVAPLVDPKVLQYILTVIVATSQAIRLPDHTIITDDQKLTDISISLDGGSSEVHIATREPLTKIWSNFWLLSTETDSDGLMRESWYGKILSDRPIILSTNISDTLLRPVRDICKISSDPRITQRLFLGPILRNSSNS